MPLQCWYGLVRIDYKASEVGPTSPRFLLEGLRGFILGLEDNL